MGKIPRGIPPAEYGGGVHMITDERMEPVSAEAEQEIPEEIRATLTAHIVDIDPAEIGSREFAKKLTDAAVGAAGAQISRPYPPIEVVSADIARSKSKVFVGPNGAGKSTALDAFMERGAHLETRSGRGAVVFGRPVHAREKLRIARLDQEELLDKIDEHSAGTVLTCAAAFFKEQFPVDWSDAEAHDRNLANQDAHLRIEELLSRITKFFDMEQFLNRKVQELSGGERTKLALMMTLISEPDALLLDEPTNHLDLRSIAKLMGLFKHYKEAGVGILSVSHVSWFLEDAGQDGVLEIVWDKDGRRLQESNSPYHRYVKDASRERVPIISGDISWPQEGYGYKRGVTLIETPQKFTVPDSPLKEIAMPSVGGGEFMILSGDNGTGKTKLMEAMISGQQRHGPRRGKGVNIAHLPQFWPEEVTRGTLREFFFWVKDQTNPHSTGSSLHKDKTPRNAFVELARDLNFGGTSRIGEAWLNRPFSQFSGGEQRLLWFLAVSALRDVDMLALDEPTNHMDRDLQEKVTRAIQSFPGAVMLSTHDRNLMAELSKDGGTVLGAARSPRHLLLERHGEVTEARLTDESPIKYMERVMKQARQQAQQLKIA